MSSEPPVSVLLNAMKHAAAALRDHDIEFALAGGLAVYARGGPETEHDVDFVLRKNDAQRALEMLGQTGFRCERPPEGWLYKVYDENDAMIDLIFAPNNNPGVVDDVLERADELEVYAITMKVMSVTDVLATKLLALKEHEVDYDAVLEIARACREQIDWTVLRERTGDHPYAKAFFTLADELGLSSARA
jgi:predicted nucleotidyltransferase